MMTAALFALLLVGLSVWLLSVRQANPISFSEVNHPPGMSFRLEKSAAASLSISPSGRLLVFSAAGEKVCYRQPPKTPRQVV